MRKITTVAIAVTLLPSLFLVKAQAQGATPVASVGSLGVNRAVYIEIPGMTLRGQGTWLAIPKGLLGLKDASLEKYGLLQWNLITHDDHPAWDNHPAWMEDATAKISGLSSEERNLIWQDKTTRKLMMNKAAALGTTQEPPENITHPVFARTTIDLHDRSRFLFSLRRVYNSLTSNSTQTDLAHKDALAKYEDAFTQAESNVEKATKLWEDKWNAQVVTRAKGQTQVLTQEETGTLPESVQFAHISSKQISKYSIALPEQVPMEALYGEVEKTLTDILDHAKEGDRIEVILPVAIKSQEIRKIRTLLNLIRAHDIAVVEVQDFKHNDALTGQNGVDAKAVPGNVANAPLDEQPAVLLLKAGTRIELEVRYPVIGEKSRKIGDNQSFFMVTHNVKVGENVVIPAGVFGYGNVVDIQPPHRFAQNGRMTIRAETVNLGYRLVRVQSDEILSTNRTNKDTPVLKRISTVVGVVGGVLTAVGWQFSHPLSPFFVYFVIAVVAAILVGMLTVIFGGSFIKGDEAVIPEGTRVETKTLEDIVVNLKK